MVALCHEGGATGQWRRLYHGGALLLSWRHSRNMPHCPGAAVAHVHAGTTGLRHWTGVTWAVHDASAPDRAVGTCRTGTLQCRRVTGGAWAAALGAGVGPGLTRVSERVSE